MMTAANLHIESAEKLLALAVRFSESGNIAECNSMTHLAQGYIALATYMAANPAPRPAPTNRPGL